MKTDSPVKLALYYALPFVLIITAMFLFLLFWERRNLAAEQQQGLTLTANTLLQQVIVTRLWNAEHGGLYALIDDRTQPNPYLDIPERDIVSLSGKRFTKINPAYMTRQIAELARNRLGYRFNITSLKPLNPANRPDPWEEKALRSFEAGADRQMAEVQEKGKAVFRYMVPLRTEQACLACHAKQGYKIGEIRGGISAAIPLEESERLYLARARTYLATGVGLWLSIVVFILLASYTLSRKVVADMTRELELSKLKTALEMAGAAAHEIRQPLTVLSNHFGLLKRKTSDDPEQAEELEVMAEQCRRINDIIVKMKNMTVYRSKTYVNDMKITDLGEDTKKG